MITSPTVAGNPIVLPPGRTTISGSAHPGAGLRLVHDGDEIAETQAGQAERGVLSAYLDGRSDDDGALARMAVMEGQATWLMSEVAMQKTGRSLKDSPAMVEAMSRMMAGTPGQYPVFDQAPLYIRESLIFPYASGMRFQQAWKRARSGSIDACAS